MKKIKGIIKSIIIVIIALVTLFNIYNLVNTKVLKNDITTINSYAVLEVVSGSMNPYIKIGDLIVVNTDFQTINPGDIITYKDDNNLFVTHRVIMKEGNTIVTKGDANNSIDKPIKIGDVVGKYEFKIDYVGKILNSLRSPFTLVIILIFGTAICIILSLDIDDLEDESIIDKSNKKEKTKKKKNDNKTKTKKKKLNTKKNK